MHSIAGNKHYLSSVLEDRKLRVPLCFPPANFPEYLKKRVGKLVNRNACMYMYSINRNHSQCAEFYKTTEEM